MGHTFANHAKTAMLMAGLFGLFLVVGAQFGQGGLIMALLFGGVTNLVAFFFSDTIAIRSMQGREVTPDNTPVVAGYDTRRLYGAVDRLRQRANLPMPRVYVCPHDAPNAFATGRSPSKSAVAFTQGLLRTMNQAELEGVIAHELAHVKNRDTLISTIAATIAGVLAFAAQWFFFIGGRREGNPLVGLLIVIVAAVGAAVIKGMISRSREYIADADGARIAGDTEGLASALAKLGGLSKQIPLMQPNPAQNNLFIVEPFCGKALTSMFATHPPIEARIGALQRLRPTIERTL